MQSPSAAPPAPPPTTSCDPKCDGPRNLPPKANARGSARLTLRRSARPTAPAAARAHAPAGILGGALGGALGDARGGVWVATLVAVAIAALLFVLPALVVPALLRPALAEESDAVVDELPRLSSRYRRVAQLDVPLREISGWSPLPTAAGDGRRNFLVVVDEGTYQPSDRSVRGALHALSFTVGADGAVAAEEARDVTLRLGTLIPRLDPAWAVGGSMLDLEACVPLPGAAGLYLLAGERNPEDVTDGGANRLYVVRYPARDADGKASIDHADLLAYLRLPDLPDDAVNDRLEGVVATDSGDPNLWRVFAFKERTKAPEQPPVYFPLVLHRRAAEPGSAANGETIDADAFQLAWAGDRPLRRLPPLLPERERLGAQADACLDAAGRVWVLDRWRRELHVATVPALPEPRLELVETLDAFDLIGDVPGETSPDEPAAPGCDRAGYGRHEALAFDAHGWLWLAADLGGGRGSVVTVLAPATSPADRADGPAEERAPEDGREEADGDAEGDANGDPREEVSETPTDRAADAGASPDPKPMTDDDR